MGFFWDILQQSQISDQADRAASLEDRVAHLESRLDRTHALLQKLLERLEQQLGEDIDGDGQVGRGRE